MKNIRSYKRYKKVSQYYKKQDDFLYSLECPKDSIDDIHLESHLNLPSSSTAERLSKITFGVNVIILCCKFAAVLLSGSMAVLAVLLDSLVDLVSGAILWWSAYAINNFDPRYYPRGRRRLEPLGILVLSIIMIVINLQVVFKCVAELRTYAVYDLRRRQFNSRADVSDRNDTADFSNVLDETNFSNVLDATNHTSTSECLEGATGPIVEAPTIAIFCLTITLKLVMFLVCRRMKNNMALALAQDHRNDVISNSSAFLLGYLGYKYFKYLDPLGAIFISGYIIFNWSKTALQQTRMITGYTAKPIFISKLTHLVLRHDPKILYIDDLKAFHYGTDLIVEVDIILPISMGIRDSHDVGETLREKLERLEEVEKAFVHVDYECGYKHLLSRL